MVLCPSAGFLHTHWQTVLVVVINWHLQFCTQPDLEPNWVLGSQVIMEVQWQSQPQP